MSNKKEKKILSLINLSSDIMNEVLDKIMKYFVETVENPSSSRNDILSGMVEFQRNCVYIFENKAKDIYLDGYKQGYKDALVKCARKK